MTTTLVATIVIVYTFPQMLMLMDTAVVHLLMYLIIIICVDRLGIHAILLQHPVKGVICKNWPPLEGPSKSIGAMYQQSNC